MIKFLNKYLKPIYLKLLIYFLLGITSNLLILIQPLIIGKLIDILTSSNLTNNNKLYYLKIYCCVLIIIFISKIFTEFNYKILLQKLNTILAHKINKEFIVKLQNTTYKNILNSDKTYLIHRITSDSGTIITFFLQNIVDIIVSICSIILIVVIFYKINISFFYILCLFIPIYIIIYFLFKDKIYDSNLNYKDSLDKYFSLLNEQIKNYKFLKINQLFEYMNSKLDTIFDLHLNNVINYSKILFIFSSASTVIAQIMNIIFLFIGGLKVINNTLSIGILSSLNSYFSIVLDKIGYLINFGSNYQNAKVAVNRLKELENMNIEKFGDIELLSINRINLKNVTLTINNKKILNNINYTFNHGNIYNIKGKNGSGKSSLVSLLLGLYKAENGEILYNNINIQKLKFNSIRKNLISVVEQEPTILCDTALNNIILDNNYDKDTFYYLKNKVNINYLLDSSSENNIVTEKISGGEKQKIAILRSLIKKSDIIIMDEFNSALDKKSEKIFKEILPEIKINKIIIIITHNNYFDDISDYIINLENGSILQ
ncbi:ABC transporter ATP-binding protein [Paraclostridium bifermentans]|uniref:ABC transporter ATP-binding protein n=1 Tax=Paraclostridium bifermentans TaxID=1490 RepID=UPI0018A11A1F|nr:ABC transporter ATP-binding protein [Paraclostridium bifermentans]